MNEKRRFSRVNFGVKAEAESEQFKLELAVLNLSLKGALLHSAQNFPFSVGSTFNLRIFLCSTDITLLFQVKLVHVEGDEFGVKFLSGDIDSITHLRRVIELNTGDCDRVARELHFLLEAK